MRLEGKVALVTGATSGIGRAIAGRFAGEGARVAVNFRPSQRNEERFRAMEAESGPGLLRVPADVSSRAEVERMMGEVLARFGRIDIVVNNAGMEIARPFLEVPDEEWARVIAVNLYGPFVVAQTAARQMVAAGGGGKIINISSVHEDIPFAGYTAYCASKGGLRMLARNLALELAAHRINVNNIAPGAVATPINQATLQDPQARENALGEIPWGRFGQPAEIASLAVYLASAEADYVTGSTFVIDGGLSRQVTRY